MNVFSALMQTWLLKALHQGSSVEWNGCDFLLPQSDLTDYLLIQLWIGKALDVKVCESSTHPRVRPTLEFPFKSCNIEIILIQHVVIVCVEVFFFFFK